MTRYYNFSAGPATIPLEVLQQAKEELLDWNEQGMSVMEISHRSAPFKDLMAQVEQDFRDLLFIPDNYKILLFTAPARAQFSMIPLNLLREKETVDYFNTGIWSKVAIEEAKRYANVGIVADTSDSNYTTVTPANEWHFNPKAAYVHYTENESVNGVEFHDIPETANVPLVSDMTSNLMSRPFPVEKFGMVYAGAQKNLGPAGLTVAIIREDLIGHAHPMTPRTFDYDVLAQSDSLEYTPATFTYYMTSLVLQWIKRQGGVEALSKRNKEKAAKLYDAIDQNDFYENKIDPAYRSRMNVPFLLADKNSEAAFLEEAKTAGLVGLKGHRLVGGMRASIYNNMPEEGVDALIHFMNDFAKKHG